jgi:hypothetical protein
MTVSYKIPANDGEVRLTLRNCLNEAANIIGVACGPWPGLVLEITRYGEDHIRQAIGCAGASKRLRSMPQARRSAALA